MAEFKLPDVGEGLTEAEIVTWKVKVGDTVKVNDVIVEIETAKSLVELPCPYAGTVTELLVAEGETVTVGTPIIAVGDGAAAADARDAQTPGEPARRDGDRPVQPGAPAAAARARAWSAAPRPTAARSAAPARVGDARRPTSVAGAQVQVAGRVRAWHATEAVDDADEPARCPATLVARSADGLPAAAPGAGEAAGAQARQGPRRRPRDGHRDRSATARSPATTSRHPRRRRGRCAVRRRGLRGPPLRRSTGERETRSRSRACAR